MLRNYFALIYSVDIATPDYMGHGKLLEGYLDDPRAMFCPADDTNDPVEELAKVRSQSDNAFSSYLYRQLDRTQSDRIDDLGNSNPDLAATALLLDSNALLPPPQGRTNHENRVVNIAYHDGHVQQTYNSDNQTDGLFSLRAGDMSAFKNRLDQIMIAADYQLVGDPAAAPTSAYPWP